MNIDSGEQASTPRMPMALGWLAIVALLFVASGASCNVIRRRPPRTLPESATLAQIVARVNENTARVQSLQSTQATLHIPGVPALRTQVAMQPARRMRIMAEGPFGGTQLDLGSNDEMFWLWIKQNEPPAIFVCRHQQFAASNARQIMPIEPEWLIEAVGLTYFDPSQPIEGPFPVSGGRIEIRSRRPSAAGDLTKVTVVDEWDGTVLEQHLYDMHGQPIASALTSRYKRDPLTGAALPATIEIKWPTAQMSFRLDITDWRVNVPPSDFYWTRPEPAGVPVVDLADPRLQFTTPPARGETVSPTPALPPEGAAPSAPQMFPPQSLPAATHVPGTSYRPTERMAAGY